MCLKFPNIFNSSNEKSNSEKQLKTERERASIRSMNRFREERMCRITKIEDSKDHKPCVKK